MGNAAQKRAVENDLSRLTKRGIARFEIQALDADRDRLRTIAQMLAKDLPEQCRQTDPFGVAFGIAGLQIVNLIARSASPAPP